MQENATKFHFMNATMDTDTDVQYEDISINSEDMVKMLGINIDINKLKFISFVIEVKMRISSECFKAKIKKYNTKTKMLVYHAFIEAN